MIIEKNSTMPLIRIKAQPDFLQRHVDIIRECGFVWFGKQGKFSGKINRIESIILKYGYIILKDSIKGDNKTYLCSVSDVTKENPLKNYPKYYECFIDNISIWFKVDRIYEYNTQDLYNNFNTLQGLPVENVLKSVAPVFYVFNNEELNII